MPLIGWFAGFISAISSSRFLEKRRALRALESEIEFTRSELANPAIMCWDIHRKSVDRLQPLLFAFVPFVRKEGERRKVIAAWEKYKKFNEENHKPDSFFDPNHKVPIGELELTSAQVAKERLSALHSELKNSICLIWLYVTF